MSKGDPCKAAHAAVGQAKIGGVLERICCHMQREEKVIVAGSFGAVGDKRAAWHLTDSLKVFMAAPFATLR